MLGVALGAEAVGVGVVAGAGDEEVFFDGVGLFGFDGYVFGSDPSVEVDEGSLFLFGDALGVECVAAWGGVGGFALAGRAGDV